MRISLHERSHIVDIPVVSCIGVVFSLNRITFNYHWPFCFNYRPDSVGRGVEADAGEVDRRYSDYLALLEALKREYPDLVAGIPFPRKALMGNFTSEVIEARCHGFA